MARLGKHLVLVWQMAAPITAHARLLNSTLANALEPMARSGLIRARSRARCHGSSRSGAYQLLQYSLLPL
eukprot:5922210-Lingulodinium_polyedra.AAC.1